MEMGAIGGIPTPVRPEGTMRRCSANMAKARTLANGERRLPAMDGAGSA